MDEYLSILEMFPTHIYIYSIYIRIHILPVPPAGTAAFLAMGLRNKTKDLQEKSWKAQNLGVATKPGCITVMS